MTNRTKNLIILSCTPYFANSRFLKVIKYNICLNDIVNSPEKYIQTLALRKETIEFLKQKKYTNYLEKVDNWLEQTTNHIVTFYDHDYPNSLKQLSNPPFVLYCSGNINLLKKSQLAIIGARNHSTYGKNTTEKLCKELKNYDLVITSGLAYGIDTLAHKFALENNLKTIAVVGTGVDIIYPDSNRELCNKILQNNCLIVSELALGTKPLRHNFPQRNRIISGLSKGVIIIEAANKSGSLITAQLALEQNKEVFAIPGSIFSKTSQGCNELIKQGAKLVNGIDDILEEIDIKTSQQTITSNTNIQTKQPLFLNKNEQLILNLIKKELTTLDKIIFESKLAYPKVAEILFELELKSLVKSVPGGYINTQNQNI